MAEEKQKEEYGWELINYIGFPLLLGASLSVALLLAGVGIALTFWLEIFDGLGWTWIRWAVMAATALGIFVYGWRMR